ncbi:Rho-binding antiterminator [Marinobacterium sp. MBR-111]|jgi:Rho-binding antiterminator|uniref:Rho-binding antiterminator n=1 Tax=Marinobacterium sp. MBR-111 TaxID=3156463 RepID=UPI00339B2BBD
MNCDEHDYIEIACTFRMHVRLILTSGELIEGRALDTQRNDAGEECIKLAVGGENMLVIQDRIRKMEALSENPHFQSVRFS